VRKKRMEKREEAHWASKNGTCEGKLDWAVLERWVVEFKKEKESGLG
jgi:hypothetical protein